MDIRRYLEEKKAVVDAQIDKVLPRATEGIYAAMRYSLFAGGKRLRSILAIAATEAVGSSPKDILSVASALEFIHTYSLVHDDLPAMDNSDFRRGKPTSHKMFGDATAILTGDALLTMAFELMTTPESTKGLDPRVLQQVVCEVARAAGTEGMIGGQVADLDYAGRKPSAQELEYIHQHKTAALIRTSAWTGAVLGNSSPGQVEAIRGYGEKVGLAFQIVDDILDEVGEEGRLGKTPGGDREMEKATYPALFGIEDSKRRAKILIGSAVGELKEFDERADALRGIAEFIVARDF
jgi:geranylgeranyl diphosphate synthase type II